VRAGQEAGRHGGRRAKGGGLLREIGNHTSRGCDHRHRMYSVKYFVVPVTMPCLL